MKLDFRSLLVVVAALLLSLSSCVREEQKDAVKIEFNASFETDSLAGIPQSWKSSDLIAVSGASRAFNVTKTDKADAVFKGKAASASEYYAAMPFDALHHFSPSEPAIASMELPCVQTASVNSIPAEARLAVASTSSSERQFTFRSPLAYLKFTIGPRSGKIRSVSVMSMEGSRLSGPFSVDCSSPDPYPFPSPGAFSNVALAASGEYLTEGDYYIAMLPGVPGNLEIAFENVDGKIALTQLYNQMLERGETLDYGTAERLEFKEWDIRPVNSTVWVFQPQMAEIYLEFRTDCAVEATVTKGTDWLSIVRTKAVERKSLQVRVEANHGEDRLGQIVVESLDGKSRLAYNIVQFGGMTDAQKQRQALIDLYESAGGDGWLHNDNWCTDAPVSEWYGVKADSDGMVSEVYLRNNFLKGYLPDNIGDLSSRTMRLDLAGNDLQGSVPASAFKIFYLYLSDNEFDSIIEPENPQECLAYTIDLSGNSFRCELPESFGHLPLLQRLDLSENDFVGSVPESYANIYQANLYLYDNNLSGRLPQGIIDWDAFYQIWPLILRQKGEGFDMTGQRFPMTEFYLDYERTIISDDVFSANVCTAILTNYYQSFVDTELMKTVIKWYEAYHESGFEIIFIAPDSIKEKYAAYPWLSSYNTPSNWYYVQNFANTTVTLVDKDGYVIVNPFAKDIDAAEEYLKREFGHMADVSSPDPQVSIRKLQKATEGNGIDLVLMGDAYTAGMIEDGTFDADVQAAIEAFFSIEPVSDYKNYFNLYTVAVSSKTGDYSTGVPTAFDCWFGANSSVGGNDELCRKYTQDAIGDRNIDDALTIVLMNSRQYAGTTYMYAPASGQYGNGWSVSYIPLCADMDEFRFLVRHEALGHGFGKLADEYAHESNGKIPADLVSRIRAKEKYGWWKNLDFTGVASEVKWSQFISDERYTSERVNVYEGGYGYWSGVWVPTWRSIMRSDYDFFNPPSRKAIWDRIFSVAYGSGWKSSYEDFVYCDLKASPAVRSSQREYQHPAPPVVR